MPCIWNLQSYSLSILTFLLDTDTVKIIAIGSDPFLYLETLWVNTFSLCVCTVVCKSLGTPLRLHDNFLSSPKKINIIL